MGKVKRAKGNEYIIHHDYAEGITSKGESFYLDIEDVEKAKPYTWYIDVEGYVSANSKTNEGKRFHEKLHRVVMNLQHKDGKIVDHINRDKANNKKNNLRLATVQENSFNQGASRQNKSGVVGVFYRQRKGKAPKWVASINIDGKTRQIGHFDNKEDAIKARLEAEKQYYQGYRTQEG